MSPVSTGLKRRLLASVCLGCVATGPALAAGNVTPQNVNLFNLLSPFLSLNDTAVGQQTLTANLNQAITINTTATPALQALSISDKNLPSAKSNTVTGLAGAFGPGVNLGGGLAAQAPINGIVPVQNVGGLGTQLGSIFATAINGYAAGTSTALQATGSLLVNGYNFTSSDVSAKYYFANGTTNGVTKAVAPDGFTLPTYKALPNTADSVYDLAYGVKNTQSGQNVFGDSRPLQVAAGKMNQFDPTALAGINTNPSFPSGHTTYAYTDSILLGMLVPQEYKNMLSRAAEYANSRIVLGVHYPLDIIASRSLASYDLAQGFTNPAYINNATTTGAAINLPGLFTAANAELGPYLSAQCGASVASCAVSAANTANNPYVPSAANAATYAADLTYGLPTLSYAQAPREQAPAGGPDASILLATLYGGSTAAANTLAPNGGLLGSLTTATINQIVVNTEGQALAAFYGTSLSYWSRVNLYAAADYFNGVTGVLNMDGADKLNAPVTVASGGVLVANGAIAGATTVQSGGTLGGVGSITGAVSIGGGGTLAPGGFNSAGAASTPGTLTINGNLTLAPGSTYAVQIGSSASLANVSATATLGGAAVTANFVTGATIVQKYAILTAASVSGAFSGVTNTGLTGGLSDTLSYDGKNAYLVMSIDAKAAGAVSANQQAVVSALNAAFVANGSLSTNYATLSGANLTLAAGELGAASHDLANNVAGGFVRSFFNGGLSDPNQKGAREGSEIATFYAEPAPQLPTRKSALAAIPTPFSPYWSVWAQTFGFAERLNGDAGVGSNDTRERAIAEMVGVEYRGARDTAFGFGFGGGAANFSVANGGGSGNYNFGQLGAYVTHEFAQGLYVTGALAGGFGSVTTTRTDPAGANLTGSVSPTNIVARAEVGDRFATPFGALTPYGAFQYADIHLPAYTEAGGPFALNYAAQDVSRPLTELGLRWSRSFAQETSVLTIGGQIAWAHDFNARQFANVSLAALPGAQFTVASASPAANSALLNAGAKLSFAGGFALEGRVESQIGANFASVGGRGTLSYSW